MKDPVTMYQNDHKNYAKIANHCIKASSDIPDSNVPVTVGITAVQSV